MNPEAWHASSGARRVSWADSEERLKLAKWDICRFSALVPGRHGLSAAPGSVRYRWGTPFLSALTHKRSLKTENRRDLRPEAQALSARKTFRECNDASRWILEPIEQRASFLAQA